MTGNFRDVATKLFNHVYAHAHTHTHTIMKNIYKRAWEDDNTATLVQKCVALFQTAQSNSSLQC